MLLLATHAFASPRRAGFELASVVDQLAQPALGQAEIPRKPMGPPGSPLTTRTCTSRRGDKLPPLDKGLPHYLSFCESAAPSLLTSHLGM